MTIHPFWTFLALPFALVLQAAPVAPAPDAAESAAEPAAEHAPPAWDRSFREGLVEIRRLAESGATDEAVAVAESLASPNAYARRVDELLRADGWRARFGRALESIGDDLEWMGPPPRIRAEAHFARGVALHLGAERASAVDERVARRESARQAFESARLAAGPGVLRLDATYDQGWLALATGEEFRAQLPEISGQPPTPPTPPSAVPGVPGTPGAKPEPPPDPLQLARDAYLVARERFVDRLRMEWRDRDTQANVELIQRRLRELDEIERQREEQKQQEEQEKQDDEKQKDQQKEQDPSQDQKQDDAQDPQESDEPKEPDPSQDPEPEEPKDEQPEPEDAESEKEPQPPEPLDPKDLPPMSKEEMLKLLERLERIDEVQKELQEKLRRMRKVSVEKDW